MNEPRVTELHSVDEIERAAQLFGEVWGGMPFTAPPMVAFAHGGAYVAGAYVDGDMVGAIAGFCGVVDGEIRLHSHIAAVNPTRRRTGAGLAMKWHQHDWCADRGIPIVTWTFDPLVRRNAHFNFRRLGAEGVEYHENLYGVMDDEINAGDESDRVLVRWEVGSDRAAAARTGSVVVADGATRVETPEDIEALRTVDAAAAKAWRTRQRAALGPLLEAGRRIVGVDDQGRYLVV